MYQISVDREFCAAHALVIAGVREPVHGHNFRLTVTLQGESLDRDGLLLDFHALETVLDDIIRPMVNADLNALMPFSSGLNPSAENIARTIGEAVMKAIPPMAPPGAKPARLASVRLTEAPGCAVLYVP